MGERFATTQWSLVHAARDGTDTEARRALEALCETYWFPLYAFVRRRGQPANDAADLTQAFFADLLSRPFLGGIDPSTNRVVARYGPPAGSGAVRVANGFVWVTAHDTQSVWVLAAK